MNKIKECLGEVGIGPYSMTPTIDHLLLCLNEFKKKAPEGVEIQLNPYTWAEDDGVYIMFTYERDMTSDEIVTQDKIKKQKEKSDYSAYLLLKEKYDNEHPPKDYK
jgi:hypothetical protein